MQLPPYKTFPQISDERIVLREIKTSDLKDLIEISYYDAIPAKNESEAQDMQNIIYQDYLEGNSIHWGIVDRVTNKIVGTCGYYRGFENESGELGCVLLPNFRGKGYMTAAMKLAIEFGQKEMKLKRIWSATDRENEDAVKLLSRLNFIKINNFEADDIQFELPYI